MKVVLFCGGYGMRMRDGGEDIPKPMAMVGDRPLLWHVMRYYAHFGHKEFILAMGYGAAQISTYFRDYDETHSNDFVIDAGTVKPLTTDIADWKITFVHTGIETPIGERLRRVAPHLGNDEFFMANYADVLTDAPLDDIVDEFVKSDALASLLAVPPQSAFHVVDVDSEHRVSGIHSVATMKIRENGGYFVMRRELLDHLEPGKDLVGDTLTKLSAAGKVLAYPYDGFWMPADTVKERVVLDELAKADKSPWALWAPPCSTDPVGVAPPVPAEVADVTEVIGAGDARAVPGDAVPAGAPRTATGKVVPLLSGR